MTKKADLIQPEKIADVIFVLRGQRVILDTDLALIYGVPVKRLNEQMKRNLRRFPDDFAFRLTFQDVSNLTSQFTISSLKHSEKPKIPKILRSQFATSRWGGRRYLPYAFTEHGAIMAANILNCERAVEMSVFVVRAFVRMRTMLSNDKGLAEELKKLEKKLTGRLDAHESAIVDILRRLIKLLEPRPEPIASEQPKRPIGFQP
jgi:hypothetical protein